MYRNGKNITFTDRSNSSVDMFLRNIQKSKPLTTAEEYELWQQMHQGCQHSRNQLIFDNLRYVVTIAKQYQRSGTDLADLIMAGSLVLTRAADLFDARLGFRFITLAKWYVENEVRKAAYDHIKHNSHTQSLDDPLYADDDNAATLESTLPSPSYTSSDWHVRYDDTLHVLKRGLDQQCWQGSGEMLDDLLSMLKKGYTTSDFARKHHLTEQQMKHFLDMLHTQSQQILNAA